MILDVLLHIDDLHVILNFTLNLTQKIKYLKIGVNREFMSNNNNKKIILLIL